MILFGTYKPERHDFMRLTNAQGVQCGVYDQSGKDRPSHLSKLSGCDGLFMAVGSVNGFLCSSPKKLP